MSIPEILNFGFKADEEKLREEDLPIEEIPIKELDNNLDIPFLEQEGTNDWNLTPRMLLENFEREKTHAAKVEKVNLNYPIELYFHMGKWVILDGVHRYVKALKEGRETIRVKRISEKIAQKTKRTENKGDGWDGLVDE
jgi:hypothetical protein